MADEIVLTERRNRVAIVTLNRPRVLNALSPELLDALGRTLTQLGSDVGIGCIILRGEGRAFAAGADVAAISDWTEADAASPNFLTRSWDVIRDLETPLIACVSGLALGGGFELALACDIIVADRTARFGLPEIKLALLPGAGGTQRLPRAVGKAKAMDMCLSGRHLTAEEADLYGLVSRVVDAHDLLPHCLELAESISRMSAPAAAAIKASIANSYRLPMDEGLAFERRELQKRFGSHDAHEGMKAFIEKRAPIFEHR